MCIAFKLENMKAGMALIFCLFLIWLEVEMPQSDVSSFFVINSEGSEIQLEYFPADHMFCINGYEVFGFITYGDQNKLKLIPYPSDKGMLPSNEYTFTSRNSRERIEDLREKQTEIHWFGAPN